MEAGCPLIQISWLWYAVGVVAVYALGALWYTVLFGKKWIKAVNYKCVCGADLSNDEKCTCKPRFPWEMAFQLISTAILGLMYFVVTPISLPIAILIAIAVTAWNKSMLKFQIADWKRFTTLALIDVGYFVVASVVFILLALL